MAKHQTFEEIRRANDRKWMANARETARSFIKPLPRTSRIRRYGFGHDGLPEDWEIPSDLFRGEPGS